MFILNRCIMQNILIIINIVLPYFIVIRSAFGVLMNVVCSVCSLSCFLNPFEGLYDVQNSRIKSSDGFFTLTLSKASNTSCFVGFSDAVIAGEKDYVDSEASSSSSRASPKLCALFLRHFFSSPYLFSLFRLLPAVPLLIFFRLLQCVCKIKRH